MMTLSSFHPEYFNRNADQGNLLVLQRQLQWRGIDPEITQAFNPEADFLLIGDAFNAVMREYSAELLEIAPMLQKRLDLGLPTLLVGSSYEFYLEVLDGLPLAGRGERISEFREVSFGDVQAFGYRNTDLIDADLFVKGAFMATTLFGPVLAKSPDLLNLTLRALGVETALTGERADALANYLSQLKRTSIAD